MQQTFEWKTSYSVGHNVLDEQHRQMLDMCKRANGCAKGRRADDDFHEVLNDLAEFSRAHFEYEESILMANNIPLLEDQVIDHNDALMKVMDFIRDSLAGSVDKVALADYLQEWWSHHVLISDMKYRSALLEVGLTPLALGD
jgi:hemerythrin-like metal-binding protein